MILHYRVNDIPGQISLPANYVDNCTPEALAELVTSDFWRHRPSEIPMALNLVHLDNVDGHDLGEFEVVRDMRPVFTASPLREA